LSIVNSSTSIRTPARRTRRPAAETRQHILDVAEELFYWQGIHATGIDRIVVEAEVAPTTLYRLFGSKDDLMVAFVIRRALPSRRLHRDQRSKSCLRESAAGAAISALSLSSTDAV